MSSINYCNSIYKFDVSYTIITRCIPSLLQSEQFIIENTLKKYNIFYKILWCIGNAMVIQLINICIYL